jgi:hypothetical protein
VSPTLVMGVATIVNAGLCALNVALYVAQGHVANLAAAVFIGFLTLLTGAMAVR